MIKLASRAASRRAISGAAARTCILLMPISTASAGPIDIALDPSPQVTGETCQSYSMALAIAFHPNAPMSAKANTVRELREVERRIRAKLMELTGGATPTRAQWAAAVKFVTDDALTVDWREFASLDQAMRFAGDLTTVKATSTLGPALSVSLVKTPVMLSFTQIGTSRYAAGHIVTVFGVDLPQASMGDTARPRLLLVNSGIKYAGGVKNICAVEDLTDSDRYRASATITADYELKRFPGSKPYIVTWIK